MKLSSLRWDKEYTKTTTKICVTLTEYWMEHRSSRARKGCHQCVNLHSRRKRKAILILKVVAVKISNEGNLMTQYYSIPPSQWGFLTLRSKELQTRITCPTITNLAKQNSPRTVKHAEIVTLTSAWTYLDKTQAPSSQLTWRLWRRIHYLSCSRLS